ncbi:MAG TPA: lipase family protein, partial [Verrucomicrobiota bacterium]|nr:lipase family protein [Verrucomicrobiota bacterium]
QNPGQALPLCSYQHGTIAKRSEAPSAANSNEQLLGVVMAASGYATALPDYLGLGDSLLTHPYHHAASEATASVDMLRAARAFCSSRGVALSGRLFLIGYSHGGHATMALHRELEEYHADEFSITASAPMAGAYDLSGVTTDDVLAGRPMPNPYYFAMLLSSYQAVYRLADSLADLLAPPYDATLPPLLDGEHSGGEINAAMPDDVTKALKPEYVAALRSQPGHPLRLALRENDLYRWTPRSPMRMYHCRGDGDVLHANSQVAYDSFQARGATQVQLVDPDPSAGHGDCSIPSLILAKEWFDTLRQ